MKFKIANEYFADDAKKLHKMVNEILVKFGGLSGKDKEDFYSLSHVSLWKEAVKWDTDENIREKWKNFNTYFFNALTKDIYSEFSGRHRYKRMPREMIKETDDGKKEYDDSWLLSLDTPLTEDNEATLYDVVPSRNSIEQELFGEGGVEDEKVETYLRGLPKVTRKVVELKMDGYKIEEIKEELGLSKKQYEKQMEIAKSYEKTKVLFRTDCKESEEMETEERKMGTTSVATIASSAERTKNTAYSIASLTKQMRKRQIRDNHVLQRKSGQWNHTAKSELISDVLQGRSILPVIISEEVKGRVRLHWLIDGVQRSTVIDSFLNNGFAISKKVQIYNIEYQTEAKDNDGNPLYDEDGFQIMNDVQVFDIRGKKFLDLPEELQEKFLDYDVPVMLNLNCTKRDIAYDIARFNRCRPMNVAQNGWTGMDEEFAEYVDNILNMDFFKEECKKSNYRASGDKSGAMRRMIVESIMAINFIEEFNKDFRKMCNYLTDNASEKVFIEFYTIADRISAVANEDVAEMFDQKDSFLWFSLFSRFIEFGLEDHKYVDFMEEFRESLHSVSIEGVTYDELAKGSTKDRSAVIRKINLMEKLMLNYFGIEKDEKVESFMNGDKVASFVEEFNEVDIMKTSGIKSNTNKFRVAMKAAMLVDGNYDLSDKNIQHCIDSECIRNTILDDTIFYLRCLSDWALDVDNSSDLFGHRFIPSLVKIAEYTYKEEIDDTYFIDWLKNFVSKFNIKEMGNSEKENYELMVSNLKCFLEYKGVKVA